MQLLDRFLRQRARKRIHTESVPLYHTRRVGIPVDALRQFVADSGPRLAPYQALSDVWPQYSADFVPNYLPYIRFLAKRNGLGWRVALDLACGSGRIAEQLLRRFEHVHCIDQSPDMLLRLRDNLGRATLRLTIMQADFTEFAVPEPVPFAVCAGDSLNYVSDMQQLATVFRRVSDALEDGGFFLLDVVAAPPHGLPDGYGVFMDVAGHIHGPFRLCTWYDLSSRQEHSFVVCPDGVEEHRRVLIGPEDLCTAAAEAGLAVEDMFGDTHLYCVLQKPRHR